MSDKEKLIELLGDVQRCGEDYTDYEIYGMRIPDTVSNEEVAGHLISNGVTVRERGRWVDAYGIRKSKCTSCGVAFGRVMDADCYYCPNCGADMRPKGEGEEDG